MKFIFIILTFRLVTINAANTGQPIANFNSNINKALVEIFHLSKEAAAACKQQVNKLVVDRVKRVDVAVERIKTLVTKNDTCVAAEDGNVVATVEAIHKSFEVCLAEARKTSAKIMADINDTAQQLVIGGCNLTRLYQSYENYPSAIMRTSFYDRLKTKATLYLENARISIKKLKEITDNRFHYVVVKADYCTHDAAEEAILDLYRISKTIIDCIVKSLIKINK